MKGAVVNNQDSARKFAGLLRKLKKSPLPDPEASNDAIEILIKSFLIWDSTTAPFNPFAPSPLPPCPTA